MRKIKNNFKILSTAALAGLTILGAPAFASDDTPNIDLSQINPGTSENIKWTKLDSTPAEGAKNTISVKVSDTETVYYNYEYTKPNNYSTVEDKTLSNTITNPSGPNFSNSYILGSGAGLNNPEGSIDSINNVLYQNNKIIGEVISTTSGAKYASIYGGAVSNRGELTEVIGDFINNSISITASGFYANGYGLGGAIGNTGIIGDITGDFINNSVSSTSATGKGGAIYNSGTIGDITGDFINNSATGSGYGNGGAIYNIDGTIGDITGDFINNSATGSGYGNGGAIYNIDGTIGDITGDFINNSATGNGGAIYSWYSSSITSINNISGKFINNSARYAGGAIATDGRVNNINGSFMNNTAGEFGGAIYEEGGVIQAILGDFKNNTAGKSGGAIFNSYGSLIGIAGSFMNNTAGNYGGAIYNSGTIGEITGDFINNSTSGYGGAIYNGGSRGTIDTIKNSNFLGNYVKSDAGTAQGGAIWTNRDLNIIADNGTSTFKDNYTQVGEEKDDNAIYISEKSVWNSSTKRYDIVPSNVNFKTENNGRIDMYDNIRGSEGYTINITGDGTGTFGMYNNMYDANLYVGNTNLTTVNNLVHDYQFNTFTLTGDTNMLADVDLQAQEMDRFTANSYGEHNGNLNVVGMNLLSDAPDSRDVTEIYFAQQGLKDNVSTSVVEVPTSTQTTAYTPIYKYTVSYDNREDGGYFLFTKGDKIITPGGGTTSTGNPSDAFNPSVLSTPVSAQAGAQASMTETFRYVFEHADAFTQLPLVERISHIKANQYALSTDYNENLGSIASEFNNKAGWFRPYVTFEDMDLKNGPKVSAITYGSLFGYDSDFHKHKNGWTSLTTGYIGYNGSQLHYTGVDTTMNGGVIGVTETFYKGNFWTALTASAGASVGQSTTMYGKEDFTSLMAGLGSKTGYNLEFKEGKYILQPIMFLSYTFVNTFDYTNGSGVKITPSPAHSIQLNPSVRFIANTKSGWQPYASVGMVWNVMNENKVTANSVRLPEMSMKPYVEYGLGIQKRFKDKFTAFGQAMLRNGGRNGIALTGGFRWTIGEDSTTEKVETSPKKIVKQLTPQQKMALIKPAATTRTTNTAILKQL